MPKPHSPQQNYLLARLPKPDFERIAPFLELVEMPLGDVLYESGGRLRHVYFPTTSIVSLLYVLENGASVITSYSIHYTKLYESACWCSPR